MKKNSVEMRTENSGLTERIPTLININININIKINFEH